MRGLWIVFACMLATNSAHGMDIYCKLDILNVFNAGEYHANWYVVNSGARRPQLPGQVKPYPGCNSNWNSLGAMYRPPEVIQAPKLGRVQMINNYRVFYQSARSGEDALSIRVHWIEWSSGKLQSAVVRYDIHVKDQPL
jgi:hypothetical protein